MRKLNYHMIIKISLIKIYLSSLSLSLSLSPLSASPEIKKKHTILLIKVYIPNYVSIIHAGHALYHIIQYDTRKRKYAVSVWPPININVCTIHIPPFRIMNIFVSKKNKASSPLWCVQRYDINHPYLIDVHTSLNIDMQLKMQFRREQTSHLVLHHIFVHT